MTATPPTFVAEYETLWGTSTTPKIAAPTIAPNDCLIIAAITSDSATQVSTPTDSLGTPLTYNIIDTIQVASFCFLRMWSAFVTGGQSGAFTLTAAKAGGTDLWGFNCLRFSGVSAIGASSKQNVSNGVGVTTSLGLTTTQENSTIVSFFGDWVAQSATRAWRAINGFTPANGGLGEVTFNLAAGQYGAYGAYYPDAGAAGAKTTGLTAPASMTVSGMAVELKGVLAATSFKTGFFDDTV